MILEFDKTRKFEEYFDKHYSRVLNYVTGKVANREDAEDLVMDAFATCYLKYDTFDPTKASFSTWLSVIVSNKIKNYYRDKKYTEDIEDAANDVAVEEDMDSIIFLEEIRNELAKALELLPETQRKIVIQKYFLNKNAVEIAESLGMSHVNVRVQLNRAINKLKQYFEDKNIRWEY